jgi:hypothetical protein
MLQFITSLPSNIVAFFALILKTINSNKLVVLLILLSFLCLRNAKPVIVPEPENFIAPVDVEYNMGMGEPMVCAKSCCTSVQSSWPSSVYDIDESRFGVRPGDIGTKYSTTGTPCMNGFTEGCLCVKNE